MKYCLIALFSGRRNKDFPATSSFGSQVHVFDWNGRIVGGFRLDADAVSLEANRAGDTLFAIVYDPDPAVRAYAIPKEFLPVDGVRLDASIRK